MDEDKMKKENNEINEEELNSVAGGRGSLSGRACPKCGYVVYFSPRDFTLTCCICGTEVSR